MDRDRDTTMGGVGKVFLTTHWSQIEGVSGNDDEKHVALIELLLKKYWKPVYCYLRRRGYRNEDAKDLTQGFFHEVVLGRNLIGKADQTKGRFRTFLLTALNHYLANVHHKQAAKRHIPKANLTGMSMEELAELPQSVTTLTAEDSFTYAWVSSLLEAVLAELRAEYEQTDRQRHWQVFRDRTLRPIMEGSDEPSLDTICRECGLSDAGKASNMIVTVKRRFQALIRQHLRNSVMSDGQVEEELKEIRRFLPKVAQDIG